MDGGRAGKVDGVADVTSLAQRVQGARLVVAGQQVHQPKQGLRRVGLAQVFEMGVQRAGVAAGGV